MARLVINDNITSGRNLTSGQVLQLGGFTMGARTAVKPTTAPTIAKHHLRISLEHSEKMDLVDILSLNELLDCIAALELATDYDQIGLKPDQREINLSPITHLVAIIKEQAEDTSSPRLKTSYVRTSEPIESDTLPSGGTPHLPNSGSDIESGEHLDLPGPELVTSETLQTPDTILGRDSSFTTPTHHNQYSPSNYGPPDIYDLMYVR